MVAPSVEGRSRRPADGEVPLEDVVLERGGFKVGVFTGLGELRTCTARTVRMKDSEREIGIAREWCLTSRASCMMRFTAGLLVLTLDIEPAIGLTAVNSTEFDVDLRRRLQKSRHTRRHEAKPR